MRTERLLITLVALVFGFFLLAAGLFFLIYPDTQLDLRAIGIGSMSCGGLLLFAFFFASKRRYLLVEMGGVYLSEPVVARLAKEALNELFPKKVIDCDVIIHKKGKVEVLAQIPYLLKEQREDKLEEIETLLTATFLKYCGLKGPFIFNVSFSKPVFSSSKK